MNLGSEKAIRFIKETRASVYHLPGTNKWVICTAVSECRNRSLEGAICEAIKDHKQALEEGDEEARWEVT